MPRHLYVVITYSSCSANVKRHCFVDVHIRELLYFIEVTIRVDNVHIGARYHGEYLPNVLTLSVTPVYPRGNVWHSKFFGPDLKWPVKVALTVTKFPPACFLALSFCKDEELPQIVDVVALPRTLPCGSKLEMEQQGHGSRTTT